MPSNYPASFDVLPTPDASAHFDDAGPANLVTVLGKLNNAVTALQETVGITGSTDVDSHDARIADKAPAGVGLFIGDHADRPASAIAGASYLSRDQYPPLLSIWSGSAWVEIDLTDASIRGQFSAESVAYFAAVTTAGGALTGLEKEAFDAFVTSAKAKGYWSRVTRLSLPLGGLSAATVPAIVNAGPAADSITGYTYNAIGGLTPVSGNFIATGLDWAAGAFSATNFGLGVWLLNDSGLTSGQELIAGAFDGAHQITLGFDESGCLYNPGDGVGDQHFSRTNGRKGFWGMQLDADGSWMLCHGVRVSDFPSQSGTAFPAVPFFIGARNNLSSPSNSASNRIGGYVIGKLTHADWGNLANDMFDFFATIGRTTSQPKPLVGWGDSLFESARWYDAFQATTGQTTRQLIPRGLGGNTSTQVRTRFMASRGQHRMVNVICAGYNDRDAPQNVLTNIQAIVDDLTAEGCTTYLFLSIPNDSTETTGSAGFTRVQTINAGILSIVGVEHFADLRAHLMTQGDGSANDLADVASGIIPRSLRTDTVHQSAHGNDVWGEFIAAEIAARGW